MLSAAGGVIGVLVGLGLAEAVRAVFPGLPFTLSPVYVLAAIATSTGVGLLSGVLPARRATRLDPVESLHAE